jgi:hypothetical protein
MDQKQIAKQVMEFNKTAFDNTFNTMTTLQDNAAKLVFGFIENNPLIPESGKTSINQCLKAYQKGRENFKISADENFKKMSDLITDPE